MISIGIFCFSFIDAFIQNGGRIYRILVVSVASHSTTYNIPEGVNQWAVCEGVEKQQRQNHDKSDHYVVSFDGSNRYHPLRRMYPLNQTMNSEQQNHSYMKTLQITTQTQCRNIDFRVLSCLHFNIEQLIGSEIEPVKYDSHQKIVAFAYRIDEMSEASHYASQGIDNPCQLVPIVISDSQDAQREESNVVEKDDIEEAIVVILIVVQFLMFVVAVNIISVVIEEPEVPLHEGELHEEEIDHGNQHQQYFEYHTRTLTAPMRLPFQLVYHIVGLREMPHQTIH